MNFKKIAVALVAVISFSFNVANAEEVVPLPKDLKNGINITNYFNLLQNDILVMKDAFGIIDVKETSMILMPSLMKDKEDKRMLILIDNVSKSDEESGGKILNRFTKNLCEGENSGKVVETKFIETVQGVAFFASCAGKGSLFYVIDAIKSESSKDFRYGFLYGVDKLGKLSKEEFKKFSDKTIEEYQKMQLTIIKE